MPSQLSLADQLLSANRKETRSDKVLRELSVTVDWKPLDAEVRSLFPVGKDGGRPLADLSVKLRMLFIQHLYNLSDPELEDQVNDRLSFRRFCGLGLDSEVIDFTTFWRFKKALAGAGAGDLLFGLVNGQLEEKGLFVKKGTAIDATIVKSSNRPLSKKRRGELRENPSPQVDTDAGSTQKRGKKTFGYKGHIGTDVGSDLIRKKDFTTASPHDSKTKEVLYSGDEKAVFADSAYGNKADKRECREQGIFYGVPDKATRRRKLSSRQKKRNRQKSSVRARVEHPFAFMKTKLGYRVARAKCLAHNKLTFEMNCIIYNIRRAAYLLSIAD